MHLRGFLAACALIGALTSGVAADDRCAIESIARVLLAFEHTCSPAQCETLRTIVDGSTVSAGDRFLAGALTRVLHVPAPEDKPRLLALESDPSVPLPVRTVAGVILRLVHVPSASDRALLASVIADEGR